MVRRRGDAVRLKEQRCRRSRGLALIAVLWIVAALSVLVTGLGQAVRLKAQAVGTGRQSVFAEALGDRAVHVVLQRLSGTAARPDALIVENVAHDNLNIPVTVQPLEGLIDVNSASVQLLSQTLAVGANLPQAEAEVLAQRIVEWRTQRAPNGAQARFEAVEDLLLVPDLKYPVYAGIREMLTADLAGDGRVNPKAAKRDVLTVLARGDVAVVTRFLAARQADQPGLDVTGFDARFVRNGGGSGRYFVSAAVPLDGGRTFVFGRVVLSGVGDDPGLPWRTAATKGVIQHGQPAE